VVVDPGTGASRTRGKEGSDANPSAGVFFAGDLGFWHWSLQFTSVANSTLLANFAPIFVTVGAFALFGERVSRTFLLGMAFAILGAGILMGESLAFNMTNLLGDALGVVTAMFLGAYILTVGRLRARVSTAHIMLWSSLVTALVLLPISLAAGEGLVAMSAWGWTVLVGLALVAHAAGQGLFAYALAHLPVAFSSVGLLLEPVAAAILAWIILGEDLSAWQGAGAVAVLAGILLARRGSRLAPGP
jgi:drug/metabolite transporter (DMT)-like permease